MNKFANLENHHNFNTACAYTKWSTRVIAQIHGGPEYNEPMPECTCPKRVKPLTEAEKPGWLRMIFEVFSDDERCRLSVSGGMNDYHCIEDHLRSYVGLHGEKCCKRCGGLFWYPHR